MRRNLILVACAALVGALAASFMPRATAEPVVRKVYRDGKCTTWIFQRSSGAGRAVRPGETVVEGPVTAQDEADLAAVDLARDRVQRLVGVAELRERARALRALGVARPKLATRCQAAADLVDLQTAAAVAEEESDER